MSSPDREEPLRTSERLIANMERMLDRWRREDLEANSEEGRARLEERVTRIERTERDNRLDNASLNEALVALLKMMLRLSEQVAELRGER